MKYLPLAGIVIYLVIVAQIVFLNTEFSQLSQVFIALSGAVWASTVYRQDKSR